MAARTYPQADIFLSAWCHPDRVPDGVFFKVSRPLCGAALGNDARCRARGGIDTLAITIGQKSALSIEGYIALNRRFLRGAGSPYFSRVVELGNT